MKFLVYIASFLVILASCKKEELQPEVIGNAAFYVQGTVNGLPVNLVAGDNDYYMYSSFEENEKHRSEIHWRIENRKLRNWLP